MDLDTILKLSSELPIYKQQGWVENGSIPYLLLTLLFTIAVFSFEHYLDIRQLTKFLNAQTIPTELKTHINNDTFIKSNLYNIDKFRFGLIEGFITFTEGLILICLGYLPYLWDTAERISIYYNLINASTNNSIKHETIITCIFIILLMLHDTLFSIPFSIYKTFIIEQKHGFNKSTIFLYFKDKCIMFILSIVLGAPVMSTVYSM